MTDSLAPAPEEAKAPEGEKPATRAAELGKRTISAVALGLAAIAAAWLGGIAFLLLCSLAAAALWWEWTGVIGAGPRSLLIAIGWVAIAGIAAALMMDAPAIALVGALIGAAVAMATAQPRRLWAAAGVFYAAALVVPAVMLRADPAAGLTAIFWLFAVVWAEDTGAYFAGRQFGGPKLAPRISPNKTWSGAIGGTIAGVLAGSIVVLVAGIEWRPMHLVVALAVLVAAQLGDLLESAVKRHFGVKDASGLVPGHGGMMDRVDGILIASVAALAIGMIRGGTSAPASGLLLW